MLDIGHIGDDPPQGFWVFFGIWNALTGSGLGETHYLDRQIRADFRALRRRDSSDS